jgi:hypothetical protein
MFFNLATRVVMVPYPRCYGSLPALLWFLTRVVMVPYPRCYGLFLQLYHNQLKNIIFSMERNLQN